MSAMIGNAVLAAAKFLVAAFSGSGAMFAEAVHSTVDTSHDALHLLGIQRGERPADARHQFGHGKEVYFWTVVAGVLVFGLGAGFAISKGIDRLESPRVLAHVGWVYLVLAAGLLFQTGSWLAAWRAFGPERAGRPLLTALRQAGDPSLFPRIFGDTASIAGLLVAAAGIFGADQLGVRWADGAAGVVIGAIMALAAVLLLAETRGLLIGAAAEPHMIEDILGVAGQSAFVQGVNEVRSMQFGPSDILVNLSVDAHDHLSAGEVEKGISALEAELRRRHPAISRVFIEIQSGDGGARAEDGTAGPV